MSCRTSYMSKMSMELCKDYGYVVNLMMGYANSGKTSFVRTLFSTEEEVADAADFRNIIRGSHGHETQQIRAYTIQSSREQDESEVNLFGKMKGNCGGNNDDLNLVFIDIFGYVDANSGTFQMNQFVEILQGRRKNLEYKTDEKGNVLFSITNVMFQLTKGNVPNAQKYPNGKLMVNSVTFVVSALEVLDGVRLPVLKKKFIDVAHKRGLKTFLVVTKIDQYLYEKSEGKIKLLEMDDDDQIAKVVYRSKHAHDLQNKIKETLMIQPDACDTTVCFMCNYSDTSGDFTSIPCMSYLSRRFAEKYVKVMKKYFKNQDEDSILGPGWIRAKPIMKELSHCFEQVKAVKLGHYNASCFDPETENSPELIPKSVKNLSIVEVSYFKLLELNNEEFYRFAFVKNFRETLILCYNIFNPRKGFIVKHNAAVIKKCDIANSFKFGNPDYVFFEKGNPMNRENDVEYSPFTSKYNSKYTKGLIIKGLRFLLYLHKSSHLLDFFGSVERNIQAMNKTNDTISKVMRTETDLSKLKLQLSDNLKAQREITKQRDYYFSCCNLVNGSRFKLDTPLGKEHLQNILHFDSVLNNNVFISTENQEGSYITMDLGSEHYLHFMTLTFNGANKRYSIMIDGKGNHSNPNSLWEDICGGQKDVTGNAMILFEENIPPCRFIRITGFSTDQNDVIQNQIHINKIHKIICK